MPSPLQANKDKTRDLQSIADMSVRGNGASAIRQKSQSSKCCVIDDAFLQKQKPDNGWFLNNSVCISQSTFNYWLFLQNEIATWS